MSTQPFCITLFGATVAFILAFGASAQSAPTLPGSGGPRSTETPIPVADVKAGVSAGGIAGADVDVSVGAKSDSIGVGAGVNDKEANVRAGVDTDAGADGDKVDAGVASSAKVDAGSTQVDAGTDAGTSATPGGTKSDARAKGSVSGATGGIANVDADVDTGGRANIDNSRSGPRVAAGVDAGADASADSARVGADLNAGADGAKIGTGVNAGAEVGGAKVGLGANAAADAATGGVRANGDVGANAGGGTVGVGASVAADRGTGTPPGLNADISAGLNSDPGLRETSASGSEIPGNGTTDAPTTAGVPALPQSVSSILLPILPPLKAHRGHDAGSIEPRDRQLAMLGCIDPLSDGSCPAAPKAIPQSSIQFELVDVADGATNTATSTIGQLPHGAEPTYPQAAAGANQSFGISLADPVRTKNGLVVRCIIFNLSAQTLPIPRLDVRLSNSAGEIIGQSVLSAPSDALAGGLEKTFTLRIRPLPPHATRLTMLLVPPS